MAQSKEFVDASHALNDLSHALALLESENASLRGAVDGLCNENTKLRELVKDMLDVMLDYRCDIRMPNSLDYSNEPAVFKERARELGIEAD